MVTVDCSDDTFELMLMGSSRIVPGGEMPFIPGPFPSAIYLANRCGIAVLCAEEISALTPGAQKVFNRITDWRKGIYVPDVNQYFRLAEGSSLIVIGTMNPYGYGGVNSLNDDLRSRFQEIVVPYPNNKQEAEILHTTCPFASRDLVEKSIRFARDTRGGSLGYSVSTRDLESLLTSYHRLKSTGQDPEFALEMLINRFQGTARDTAIDRVDATFASRLKERLRDAAKGR
jgi:MoxR-like ATPase